jgi:hypothetical protein
MASTVQYMRLPFRSTVFLAVAAICNLAIAWSIAIVYASTHTGRISPTNWSSITSSCRELPVSYGGHTHWSVTRVKRPGMLMALVSQVSSPSTPDGAFEKLLPPLPKLKADIEKYDKEATHESTPPGLFMWHGYGWPFLTLSCHWPWSVEPHKRNRWSYVVSGIPINRSDSMSTGYGYRLYRVYNLRALPLSPLWTGTMGNIAFYSLLLWCLARGPKALRRLIRTRQGRCLECGYDLCGSNDQCPECGTRIPSHKPEINLAARPEVARRFYYAVSPLPHRRKRCSGSPRNSGLLTARFHNTGSSRTSAF